MSSDEKKNRDLDADILQGKADILNALRAAGKLAPDGSAANTDKTSEESLDDFEIIDIKGDESETITEDSDEPIAWPEDEETPTTERGRIVSFEEAKQTALPETTRQILSRRTNPPKQPNTNI